MNKINILNLIKDGNVIVKVKERMIGKLTIINVEMNEVKKIINQSWRLSQRYIRECERECDYEWENWKYMSIILLKIWMNEQ